MWNEGYVSEIDYVVGYFPEMSPARLKFALLSRGIGHDVGSSPTYLELGFGQGVSLAVNAATCSGSYYGTDFNPGQASHAAGLGAASGKPLHIYDQSFEQLAARTDLPEFDIIALHGIWSWVSDKGREGILKLVEERLKPGGLLYVSYNVVPGWSPLIPLRQLIWEHYQRAGSGSMVKRIEQSLDFVGQVKDLGVGYFGAHPGVQSWLETMKGQDRNYLAHEYFNAQWRPESFAQLSDRLATAKLGFGASTNLVETMAESHMAPELKALLASIDDPTLRELTKDYLVNRKFRTDIFVKGVRRLTRNETVDMMCGYSFLRMGSPETLPGVIHSSFGAVALREEIYRPIIEAFAAAEGEMASFAELCGAVAGTGINDEQLIEALATLVGTGYLAVTTQSDTVAEDYFASLQYNREVCRQARYSGQLGVLAAPGIGVGMKVGRVAQLVLHAMASGYADIADYVLETLQGQGETVMVDGRNAANDEEALAAIAAVIETVRETLLPDLERVGAVAATEGDPFAVPSVDVAAMDPMLMQARSEGVVFHAGATA